ncbi:MAG TPA: AraC family transcriptional regulator [Solirubrobacter sp.]|nr:AraC family transcriptional regulator [Solirubrobacter sp.]
MARVVRHVSVRDRWELVHGAPDPRLAAWVLGYCAYDERTGSFTRRRELPGEHVVAIVNLGAPVRVTLGGTSAAPALGFVSGLCDTYAVTETAGAQRGVQIDFTPVGAHVLTRVPAHELAGRVVDLEALFGAAGVRLHEALACAPGWAPRFELLDAFLLARLDDALSPVPSVTRALARLRASGGAVRVEALAGELGCSRRHLSARFREQVGVSPKLLARILRFQRALALAGTGPGWAEIAARCGYYDQAHMVRDFVQFSGSPPGELARRRLPDGGGVVGD